MHRTILTGVLAIAAFHGSVASADPFGSGVNSFSIDFVTIGNPGNIADTTGNPVPAGSVAYTFRIGKYEISEQMIDKANALGGLGITKNARGPDKPATSISWFEAAQFVNWLNTSTGSRPAYKFDASGNFQLWLPTDAGYNPANLFRNSQAKYFLPSANEWYKAAYFDPAGGLYWDYATGSNAPPVAIASGTAMNTAVFNQALEAGPSDVMQAGGLSAFGAMGQGGNVDEWEETEVDLSNDTTGAIRGRRGSAWGALAFSLSTLSRNGSLPAFASNALGVRVASAVPEPSSAALLGFGLLSFARILIGHRARNGRERAAVTG